MRRLLFTLLLGLSTVSVGYAGDGWGVKGAKVKRKFVATPVAQKSMMQQLSGHIFVGLGAGVNRSDGILERVAAEALEINEQTKLPAIAYEVGGDLFWHDYFGAKVAYLGLTKDYLNKLAASKLDVQGFKVKSEERALLIEGGGRVHLSTNIVLRGFLGVARRSGDFSLSLTREVGRADPVTQEISATKTKWSWAGSLSGQYYYDAFAFGLLFDYLPEVKDFYVLPSNDFGLTKSSYDLPASMQLLFTVTYRF
jgi:hypothetical protein